MSSSGRIHQAMNAFRRYASELVSGWDQFWFAPCAVDTLAFLRIVTGAMLLYSHLVLLKDYSAFVGNEAWITNDLARSLHDGTYGPTTAAWSYLWSVENSFVLWLHQVVTILVTFAFMVGFLTRFSAPLAWFLQIMILHRLQGSLFGLDQIVTYSAFYLCLSPCGAIWSVDARLRSRAESSHDDETPTKLSGWKAWLFPMDVPSTSANIATRLFQLHVCIIYLFGGLAKARGQMWWDGTALWYAIGNAEYQSWDVTFLAAYPRFFTALTHVALLWEVFYCALVWSRHTRWLTLLIAVLVHGGIALFLGMATFGLMMIAANAVFVSPTWIRRWRLGDRAFENENVLSGVTSGRASKSEADRLTEIEKAEKAFKKRYAKLKSREAKVEERNQRLKVTKAKIREKIQEGIIRDGDSQLDNLIAETEPHAEDEDMLGGSSTDIL